jgi:clan AA aspartic protease
MIIGRVNSQREAVIQIAVLGENGQRQAVSGIIDTGYTGFLSLPLAIIERLDLPWIMQEDGTLGDGSVCMFDTYRASVIWDGQVRMAYINASETEPLVGMGLIEGFELKIQGIAGGIVTLSTLSL